MGRELRYQLPAFGLVAVDLHQESAELYAQLEKCGEIRRLQHLDHLGAVRLAWPGAHHSRWEYAFLTMRLCEIAAERKGSGLNTPVRVGSHRFSSGTELLKCWSLLLNVGHLGWTFATERALLFVIAGNRKWREVLLDRIPTGVREWARRLIRDNEIYKFHQVIAFVRLRMLLGGDAGRWQGVLGAYVHSETGHVEEKVRRLAAIYRKLRRLAYLALDPLFVPSPVQISLAQLLTSHETWSEMVLGDGEDALMDAVEENLALRVYLSEPVLRAVEERSEGVMRESRRVLRTGGRNGLEKLIELLARGDIQREAQKGELRTVVRVPVWGSRLLREVLVGRVRALAKTRALAEQAKRLGGKTVRPVVWTRAGQTGYVVQLCVPRDAQDREAMVAIKVGLDEVRTLRESAGKWRSWLGEKGLHEELLDSVARSVIEGVLGLWAGERVEVRWARVGGLPLAAAWRSREGVRALRKWLKRVRVDDEPRRGEVEELEGKKLWLEEKCRGEFVVMSLGRITLTEGGRGVGEIDGVVLSVRGKHCRVAILEVKGGRRSGAGAGRRQLRSLRGVLARGPAQWQEDGAQRERVRVWSLVADM